MVIEKMQPPTDGSHESRVSEPVAYFYCHRNEEPRRDPKVIMASIVKQLTAPLLDSLPEQVVKSYEKREKDGHASGCLELPECLELIITLLGAYTKATIIIDALDEALPDQRGRLITALKSIIDSTKNVRIFVSSRNDIDIRLKLQKLPHHYIESTDNQEDIERFVHREIKQRIEGEELLFGCLDLNHDLTKEIIRTLAAKANGM